MQPNIVRLHTRAFYAITGLNKIISISHCQARERRAQSSAAFSRQVSLVLLHILILQNRLPKITSIINILHKKEVCAITTSIAGAF